jgi:ATP-binding cassette subfamily B protein
MSHKDNKEKVFDYYWRETKDHGWQISLIAFGTFITMVADLTAPLYLKQFFNILTLGTPTTNLVHQLLFILALIGLFYFLSWVGNRITYFTITFLESKVMAQLYERAFSYLIDHSYRFFSSQFSGTLTRRVSKFVGAYETIFDAISMQFIPTALFVAGAVTILFLRNHLLGIALGGWTIFFIGFQLVVAKKQHAIRAEASAEDSRLTGSLADAISNQNTISLFAGNYFERERFSGAVRRWLKTKQKSWLSNEYIWGAMGFFVVLINVGLLYGALHFWQLGQLTIGDFVLIQAYLIATIQQLFGINRNLRRFYDSYAEAQEMIDIINEPHEVHDLANAQPLSVGEGAIHFKNVVFYFNENQRVLKGLSLDIHGGEKIAFVGPSGAGKSTITRLLLRFYDVREGAIEIDGQDIRAVTQNTLREAIAFVPQEPILFHRSLMENIRYGRRDATDEEVIEAAKKAHCHEFISGFPDQYETFVGERGVKLSGGERQRVAIARAILKNAPILVLDEATSSLDSESEHLIQDALQTLMRGKTVIVIAHRLSTIMKMDRIVVIEHGEIAAEGTHEELLNNESGLYHKLWSIQAGGFLVDEESQETS